MDVAGLASYERTGRTWTQKLRRARFYPIPKRLSTSLHNGKPVDCRYRSLKRLHTGQMQANHKG